MPPPPEPTSDALAIARVLTPVAPAQRSSVMRMAALARSVPPAADLVLLGDSLAAGWPGALLAESAAGLRAFNYGLPGDRVQHTRWRLQRGDVAHLRPRHAVIVLGTNNLGDGDPVEAIVLGLQEVVGDVRRLWHRTDVLLATVPWRHLPAGHEADRLRLNAALLALAGVRPLDADRAVGRGTRALVHLESDRVHLNAAGYGRLGTLLRGQLDHEPRAIEG